MDDLRELYQDTILSHNKKPRNFRVLADANHEADGHNPLCGDELTLYARVNDKGRVEEVTFQGSGCAISKASASLMTDFVKGKTLDEAEKIKNTEIVDELSLPPVKIHCSVLAEDAIKAAISDFKTKNNDDA